MVKNINPFLFRTPTIPRKSPRKRNIWLDESVLFQAPGKIVDIDSISEQNLPENFTFKRLYMKRLYNSGLQFNLKCNERTGILAVGQCLRADRNLHVCLLYHGMKITVPLINLVCLEIISKK